MRLLDISGNPLMVLNVHYIICLHILINYLNQFRSVPMIYVMTIAICMDIPCIHDVHVLRIENVLGA